VPEQRASSLLSEYKLEPQGSLSLHLEVRRGYIRTQEHRTTGRFGVALSL